MSKIKSLTIPEQQTAEIREQALNAIRALNNLILAGVHHENIIQADFLLNTWFDAVIGEDKR